MFSWYDEAIFYHIYTFGLCNAPFRNDYAITENRLSEIEKWIPHIKNLGCNAVCFSPVFKSLTHGYDTTDYFQIDNRLGDNEDFRSLSRRLHDEGIRVVLDGVFNHCGRDFFAFLDIREKGASSIYRDWISGLDFSRGNSLGERFSYDTWSGYDELVKFNLKNPEVISYFLDAVRHWIDTFDIDGLRLDSANVLDFDFMNRLRRFTEATKKDFWLMGEVVHGDYGRWINEKALHSVTNYELYKSFYSSHNDENLFELSYSMTREFGAGGLYRGLTLYNFVDNHDQDRLASVVDNPAYLYTIYILLFTAPGIPSIYYGSEWGVKGEKKDGSDAGIRQYIDIGNVKKEEPDLERVIKKLTAIRQENAPLKRGGYKQVYIQYKRPFIFERVFQNETIIVAINSSDRAETVSLRQYRSKFYDILNDEIIESRNLDKLSLSPHWGRILKVIEV